MKILPLSRTSEIIVNELKDELLIYDLTIDKAYCLNKTSALIWNLCDGNNSVSDITKQLSKKLKSPVTDDLIWLALDQFKEDNLLSDNEKVEIEFDGLSRREVIRRVGFASLIALPVIASLIAPTAAMAASAGGSGITGTQAPGTFFQVPTADCSTCGTQCSAQAPSTCTSGTATPGAFCVTFCNCQCG